MRNEHNLKRLLRYNPNTGDFVWLKSKGSSKAGNIAGSTLNGYIKIKINERNYYAHQLAWFFIYNEWPHKQIDHINHIRSDNRIDNLRIVSGQENYRNQKMHSTNTSGIAGVYWRKDRGVWRSIIHSECKQINLGSFENKFDAICARKSAENKYGYHENHGRPCPANLTQMP